VDFEHAHNDNSPAVIRFLALRSGQPHRAVVHDDIRTRGRGPNPS